PVVRERELADAAGDVIARGLDLLQAEHVRLLLRQERDDLLLARADAVDVPGRDLHGVGRSTRLSMASRNDLRSKQTPRKVVSTEATGSTFNRPISQTSSAAPPATAPKLVVRRSQGG